MKLVVGIIGILTLGMAEDAPTIDTALQAETRILEVKLTTLLATQPPDLKQIYLVGHDVRIHRLKMQGQCGDKFEVKVSGQAADRMYQCVQHRLH
jgi:hypothetical protein